MPRGIKGSVDFDSKVQVIDERIERYSKKISDLKSQRQELLSKKEEVELQGLYEFINENNLTIQDVIDKLTPNSEPSIT